MGYAALSNVEVAMWKLLALALGGIFVGTGCVGAARNPAPPPAEETGSEVVDAETTEATTVETTDSEGSATPDSETETGDTGSFVDPNLGDVSTRLTLFNHFNDLNTCALSVDGTIMLKVSKVDLAADAYAWGGPQSLAYELPTSDVSVFLLLGANASPDCTDVQEHRIDVRYVPVSGDLTLDVTPTEPEPVVSGLSTTWPSRVTITLTSAWFESAAGETASVDALSFTFEDAATNIL